jgi:hypothetical protein
VVPAAFGFNNEFVEARGDSSFNPDGFAVEGLRVFENIANRGVDNLGVK